MPIFFKEFIMFHVPATTAKPASTAQDKEKQAKTTIGYVNHYIRLKDGSRIKMHSELTLRLYAERKADAKLIEMIKAGIIEPKQVNGMFELEISIARDEAEEIEFDL